MMAAQTAFDELREKYKKVILSQYAADDAGAFKAAIDALDGSDPQRKMALEQAFRDSSRAMLVEGKPANDLTAVVTCAVNCARQDLCGQVVPFTLLSDILDCVTLDVCTDVFHYVDSHVNWWLEPRFYTMSGKNLLLRVCNNLLRRMSKPQNTVFCGRIQLFLAHLFPIYEKSALNLTSQFNQDNITEFKTTEEIEATSQNAMDTGDPEPKIDYQVYQQLWSLQSFFSRPSDCYTTDKWLQFRGAIDGILNVFVMHPLESLGGKASTAAKGRAGAQTDALVTAAEPCSLPIGSEQEFYFPKYLTSEKLMDLELHDCNFRRQILVQMLVVFQYLTGSIKFKAQNQVLTDAQDTWVKTTKNRVFEVLKKTPPNGEAFTAYIEQMMQREESWIDWKNNSCPRFTKPREDFRNIQAPGREKRRAPARPQYTPNKRVRWDMGSSELTRVWNINPDNLQACSAKERQFTPSLGVYFDEAIEQSDPDAMVEDQYKVVNESGFQWRALRLLSRHSSYFFAGAPSKASAKSAVGPESISSFLESTITQIAKDISTTEQQASSSSSTAAAQQAPAATAQPQQSKQQQPAPAAAVDKPMDTDTVSVENTTTPTVSDPKAVQPVSS